MADCMMFPNDWKKFLTEYSFIDHKEFYTNGSRLIPTFRVEQMIEHYFATDNNVGGTWIPVSERFPENDTAVIVATDNGMVFQCLYSYDGWDLWDGYRVNITHWMQLPEPPKERYYV